MNQKPLHIGLIGTAEIADNWLLPALTQVPDACLWSVLSRTQERGQAFAQKHGAAAPQAVHTTLESFLSDPNLDAVIIASPDRLHAAQAIAAAEAGKHLFVEKPLATSAADAEKLVAICRERGLRLAVGYHLHWHAGHRELKKLLDARHLGNILRVNVQWTYTPAVNDWRASNDTGRWWSLAAVGTHCIDLCLWLMEKCGSVEKVESQLVPSTDGAAHDQSASVKLIFETGAAADIYCSVTEKRPRLVEIVCEQGIITCTNTLGPRGTGEIIVDGKPLQFVPANPYAGELQDFVTAVLGNSEPECRGTLGLLNVQLLERC